MRKEKILGKTFGMLTVIRQNARGLNEPQTYLCRCSCGGLKSVYKYQLTSGITKSCGCLRRDSAVIREREDRRILDGKPNKNNTSGYKGVYWMKKSRVWIAKIGYNNHLYHLCCSNNINDCIAERHNAEEAIRNNAFQEYIGSNLSYREGMK